MAANGSNDAPEAGAPEAEVTPAMIAAGVAVISQYGVLDDLLDGSIRPSQVVEQILYAAIRCSGCKA